MWVFYVNRGQAIASFGTKDKDHAILEFLPANRAWQETTRLGFRTFIKVKNGKKEAYYENGVFQSKVEYDEKGNILEKIGEIKWDIY